MRILPLLLVLCLVPVVGAQPSQEPNFQDPAGDQVPPGPATGWADLRRGWVSEDDAALQVTLEVNALGATDPFHYEVLWLRIRQENVTGMGLVASQANGRVESSLVLNATRSVCTNRQQSLPSVPGGLATATYRTPGLVQWRVPLKELALERGDILYGFCAFSYSRTPVSSVANHDGLRTPPENALNQSHQVGLWKAVQLGMLDPHAETLYIDDSPERDPRLASYDIEGFQFHPGIDFVNTTIRLRSLSFNELEMRQWYLNIHLQPFNPYGSDQQAESLRARLMVRNGTLRFAEVDHERRNETNETLLPGTLFVQTGTPGFARFSVPRSEWKLPTDLGGIRGYVFLSSLERGEQPDHFGLYPERFFDVPVPIGFVMLGLGGALWFRRRQR